MISDESVKLFAIVLLEVMRARRMVDVRAQLETGIIELKDGAGGVQKGFQRVAALEAAVVLDVIGEQCRPRVRSAVRCV